MRWLVYENDRKFLINFLTCLGGAQEKNKTRECKFASSANELVKSYSRKAGDRGTLLFISMLVFNTQIYMNIIKNFLGSSANELRTGR